MAFGDVIREAASPSTSPYGVGGDANTIWHCDGDADKVYELDTSDFSEVRSAASPSSRPEGIGGNASKIWLCDSYADKVYELDASDLSQVRSAASPSSMPWGIGGDTNTIWHSEGYPNRVYELDTSDFSEIRHAAPPGTYPKGIGGDANTIWNCDSFTDKIYETSTTDFSNVRDADSPSIYPSGIGGDANTIWHSDSTTDKIYELNAAVAPTVTTQAVSSIDAPTATGNGNITATGGEDASAWGTCLATTIQSGYPDTGDTVDAGSGTGGTGAFTTSIDGLSAATRYYVRAYATNTAGTSYGALVTFATKIDPPADLACTVISQGQINLTWTKGSGIEKTLIRRKVGSYPSSTSDGDQIYFDTGTSHSDTTCSCGTHYYYRAWSYISAASTETLRPSAAGDETNCWYWDGSNAYAPDVLHNFEQVDEAVKDDDSTYVRAEIPADAYFRDLYNVGATSGSGTINKVTVKAYCKCAVMGYGGGYKLSIKPSGGAVSEDTPSNVGVSYELVSHEWATNPDDSEAWEWADLADLQIGIALENENYGEGSNAFTQCTQIWAEVDYEPPVSGYSDETSDDNDTTTACRILRVITAQGRAYRLKTAKGSVYRLKTVTGRAYRIKAVNGTIYRLKAIAGSIYRLLHKEG